LGKKVWYRNLDLSFNPLEKTDFRVFQDKDRACFQIAIPWDEVKPYHPYIAGQIGINFCYVQAVREQDKIYHYLKRDVRIQNENSRRKYRLFSYLSSLHK